MKNRILLLSFLFVIKIGFAQDTIIKYNNDKVIAKILEISPDEVKYKKFAFLDGPTYIERKSDIKMVIYSNGVKETFQREQVKEPTVTVINSNDDYVNGATSNNKIDDWGARYRYQKRTINEREMHYILLQTKDKKIIGLVGQAKDAKKMEFVGFAAIPLGIIGMYSLAYAASTYQVSDRSTFLTIGGVCFAAAISCPIISSVNKHKKVRLNSAAIKIYNQKF
ncbi:MAG TPA: hypothetical protein VGC65_10620 [Bacteroidia bacterium]|jgi:hypothetical protein